MVGASLLALAAFLGAARAPGTALGVSLAGTALLAAGVLLGRGTLVGLGLALVGAGYGISVVGGDFEASASLAAGGLLLVAELGFWAIEPGAVVRVGSAAAARRAVFSAGLALAGTAVSALLLAAAAQPLEGGVVLGVLGFVALGVIAVVAVGLLRSSRSGVE